MSEYTTTPNLGLYKPNVDGDEDLWGDHTNANWDMLDSLLQFGAGIIVSGVPPTLKAGAAWFDSVSTQLYVGYDDGNSLQWVIANNYGGGGGLYLPLSGGTVSGNLTVNGNLSGTALAVTNNATVGGTLTSSNTLDTKFITTSRTSNFTIGQVFGNGVSLWSASNTTGGAIGSGSGAASSYLWRTQANTVDATAQTGGFWNVWFDKREGATKGNQGNVNVVQTQTARLADTGQAFWNAMGVKLDLENSDNTGQGNAIALSPIIFMGASANWGVIEAVEMGFNRTAGSVVGESFIQVMNYTSAAYSTSGVEGFFALNATRGSGVGLKGVFSMGRGHEQWALDSSAWFWTTRVQGIGNPGGTQVVPQVMTGLFDASKVRVTDSLLRSQGLRIGGAGDLYVGPASLKPVSGGAALDATGTVGSVSGIAAGGTGYMINDELYVAGGIAQVTTVSAGVITAVAFLAGQQPFSFTTPPTNPVPVEGGTGTGATLNLTWTAQPALSLQPSGGAATFGGPVTVSGAATFSAAGTGLTVTNNASVSGTLTAVGDIRAQSGGLLIGTNAGTFAALYLNAAANRKRTVGVYTAGTGAAQQRWTFGGNGTAEGGSNAGTDYVIEAYSDAGALLYTPILITRSTGAVTFGGAAGQINIGSTSAPNIRSGTGAATGTQPAGSIFIRTDGSAGARIYVSQGGGTWTPIASV